MHNLLILNDQSLSFIQEPFLSDFVKSYWDKIALVIPVTRSENFKEFSYSSVINRGHTVDLLFAIVPNPHHPLDVDWIFLRPRQAHPWWYGNHPATSNFNSGGSTHCFEETLRLVETLSKGDRVQNSCCYMPELYSNNPPRTFESLYSSMLFHRAQDLANSNYPSFDDLHDKAGESYNAICLGLYGCNDATLNMQWRVESMLSAGFWISTTLELADKVTLAMRLSGESDHNINVRPSEAFEQWMGNNKDDAREPLLIRTKDDILFCDPQVSPTYRSDAYFLDCEQQNIQRLGRNGGDILRTLKTWGINPKDERLRFLF
ncbi:hypothetical protein [Microcoleus sp. herbarium14]|uniref:hypothetical protein n=1 Tax=Microcoleus sp. herbarium14 TaxID=3055439 RepID=UPI002FCF5C58